MKIEKHTMWGLEFWWGRRTIVPLNLRLRNLTLIKQKKKKKEKRKKKKEKREDNTKDLINFY